MNFPLPILNDLTLGYAKTTIIIRGRWTGASQRLDAVRGRFEQHRSCWNLRSPPERMANKSHVVKHGQGEALLIDPFDFTRGKTKWTYQSRIDLIYYPPAHQDSTQELGLCIGTEQSHANITEKDIVPKQIIQDPDLTDDEKPPKRSRILDGHP